MKDVAWRQVDEYIAHQKELKEAKGDTHERTSYRKEY